jgi:tetratricopeptide (TPR) repeat protein
VRPRAAGLAGIVLALACGCSAPGFEDYAEDPGPYDALEPVELSVLAQARRTAAEGDLDLARRRLETLCAARPDNLIAGTALQEVELALLAAGAELPGLPEPSAAAGTPVERLYTRYRGRAETYGTAAGAVLAARLAPDAGSAAAWLERALAEDPGCAWAHYGLAHVHANERRFGPAWDALERALAIDPGHPSARRLEAQFLTRRGDVEGAVLAWRAWLTRYGGDPRIAPSDEAAAHLELANLLAQSGHAEAALATLDSLDPEALDDAMDATLVRVVALDGVGRVDDALRTARAAAADAPLDPRPLVQEALILGDRLGDDAGARAAWEEVLRRVDAAAEAPDRAASGGDPAAGELLGLLLRLQANAALARLDAAAERARRAAAEEEDGG